MVLEDANSEAFQAVREGVQVRVFLHRAAPAPQVVLNSFDSINGQGLVGVGARLALLEDMHNVLYHFGAQRCALIGL